MTERPWTDKKRLRRLYVEEGLSSREVAAQFDCSKSTVLDWLKRHGIETRQSARDKPPNFRTIPLGYEQVRTNVAGVEKSVYIHRLVAVSEWGVSEVIGRDVHHKNDVPWDNRPENLRLVDRSDHVSMHHEEGLYDDHLEQVHKHRDEDGRLASPNGGKQ